MPLTFQQVSLDVVVVGLIVLWATARPACDHRAVFPQDADIIAVTSSSS
jgi:hypothetical protein